MSKKHYFLSAALGAVSVLAFAPFELFPLIFLTLAGLIILVHACTPKQAFWVGFFFGLGLYLCGVSWVYVSLSTYGGMPLWMGTIAVLGFASILASFTALACWSAKCIALQADVSTMFSFPFTWVIFEWSKSWVLTGFPWLDVGYTQTPSWLMAWAPIGGIYLLGFVVVVIAVCLASLWQFRSAKTLSVIAIIVLVSFSLQSISWTQKAGNPISVGVVQANVPIETKWLEQTRRDTVEQYRDLSHELSVSQSKIDLLVWPETALPLYASQTDKAFWNAMAHEGAAVLAGLLDHDGTNSYNAAALSCADSRAKPQLYRKRHLVPFGEYQPLKFLFAWVFDYLQLPMSDFAGWQGQQSLECGEALKLALSICYEDTFSNEYRAHLGDSTVLINISEDAWFGDSFAPHQRTQLAQMRARELGRPMVRAANSGPSLFIDEFGRVKTSTEQFRVTTAAEDVQPMTGETPFIRFGSWIVWLSFLIISAMLLRTLRRKN